MEAIVFCGIQGSGKTTFYRVCIGSAGQWVVEATAPAAAA